MTTAASPSIARIVREGLGRKPATSALFGAAAILWMAGTVGWVVSAFMNRGSGLARLAFPLMNCAWYTGFMLFLFGQVVSSASGWQRGAIGEHRRGRVRRWLDSPDATFVDLSGAARQRATTAAAKDPVEQPDATIIATPVLTALAAACFGFAGAMALAETYAAPRNPVFDDPYAAPFWCVTLVFMLSVSLWNAGRQNQRVYGWASDRAAAAARAQADVEKARLGALQAQMNPHFLFNTLNTVAALAGPESARAESVVEHLSAVLRHSLQRADRPFTSVGDEVQFAREYLDVEQARLGTRLQVRWNIGPETVPMRVPTMCLLPLIENAVAYGVEPRPGGGHIQISSLITAGGYLLQLSVEDDGPGFPAGMQDGRGLAELRQRLWAEYERTYELDTETLPTGARATITVPATRFTVVDPATRGEARA